MDNFDKTAIGIILKKLTERLNRQLTEDELSVFSLRRSGIAYEMMIDYISDTNKTRDDIENYTKEVVAEYHNIIQK